ncbi:glycosyltransferase family 2 protein [Mucilaginibacter sp. UR6-11]|uniref:glycosyltransferase family 2 protein n=1 Tax=Mucilaginibacter sp. UR6-11 TaxID=1435644 RepID=UPI001E34DDE1|nr:glycosyltransferase family 2 protein [Mucilaginibacter sp. UR6-11]MCC8423755.1 glycosyltransferase [Mucilaginibacter sp. UR6-11]
MKPVFIPTYISHYLHINRQDSSALLAVKNAYQHNLLKTNPIISIVIPAYNEEENIVPTLASLCNNLVDSSVEIIVVNNNSSDNTEELVKACGVTCILETKQGITNARNAGLAHAKGKYILNADADTIYPRNWIDEMSKPLLKTDKIAVTYGRFSFIPTGNTGRIAYYFYETLADITRLYNNYKKTEAVNVYGFNSGFRREQGLLVDGFNHPPGTNEDGYLALKLYNKGFGKMHRVSNSNAIVWTTDRRIQIDGGLFKAVGKRVKRLFNIGN